MNRGSGTGTGKQTRRALVGWVVDVQRDFMEPEGRLYVRDLGDPGDPGAREAEPAIREAVAWMRDHTRIVVFTGDWHGPEDPEIDAVSPDPARGTYPPHCMGRSVDPGERAGAEIIPSVAPREPWVLAEDAGEEEGRKVAGLAVATGRPVMVRKTRFDVFAGNPAANTFVEALAEELGLPLHFVVAGVARDVCVTQAVDGLQARGHPVTVVRDATWGLGLEPEEETVSRWQAAGGTLLTVRELEEGGGAGFS